GLGHAEEPGHGVRHGWPRPCSECAGGVDLVVARPDGCLVPWRRMDCVIEPTYACSVLMLSCLDRTASRS
ncbi:hypothetical protein AB1L88_26985, partial [Tautonia sp. JC769]|uniref:hypothetical protein n=1 Tax=Tautonia sp. JC769 TaxID=3232135 RepID=UPI00345AFFE9